jgi:hypothetical protein
MVVVVDSRPRLASVPTLLALGALLLVVFAPGKAGATWDNARLHHLEKLYGKGSALLQEAEKASAAGKSETNIANLLETHLYDSIKGMVSASGESVVSGQTNSDSQGNHMLKGQGKGRGGGRVLGKGKGKGKGKDKEESKMSMEEKVQARLTQKLLGETHAQEWAKMQAKHMAKSATAQQQKETMRIQAQAHMAAREEMRVLHKMAHDMHRAQKATAASLPKLELNPRLTKAIPKPLTEDEKLMLMLRDPDRYAQYGADEPADPARPNTTDTVRVEPSPAAATPGNRSAPHPTRQSPPMGRAQLLKEQQAKVDAAAGNAPSNGTAPKAPAAAPAHEDPQPRGRLDLLKEQQAKVEAAAPSTPPANRTARGARAAPALHVAEKLRAYHAGRNATKKAKEELAKKTPKVAPSAFLDLSSFLDVSSPVRRKAAGGGSHRNHHVVRFHHAAPSFWPKKRTIKPRPQQMPRFSAELEDVSVAMKDMAKKAFEHPFWNTRPKVRPSRANAPPANSPPGHGWPQEMRFARAQQQQQQAPRMQQQAPPMPAQANRPPPMADNPFGYNDVNGQGNNRLSTPDFSRQAGGMPGAPNGGGLPPTRTSANRPADPMAGNIGPSGGNPFAGTMPPPSAVKYEYGSANRAGGRIHMGNGRRPPPPPPPAVPPPPPVGQRSRSMPMPMVQLPPGAGGGAPRSKGGVDTSFLPSAGKGESMPPPSPMPPQQAAAVSRGGTVMAPSVVTTVPYQGRL